MEAETNREEEGEQKGHQDDEVDPSKDPGQNERYNPNNHEGADNSSKIRVLNLLSNCGKKKIKMRI